MPHAKNQSTLTGSYRIVQRHGHMTHEQSAEIHAIKRLGQRYGLSHKDAIDLMFEHLAMILAGEWKPSYRTKIGKHAGNEVYDVYWEGQRYMICYDPEIKRIVTYVPPTRLTKKIIKRGMRRQERT